MNHIHPAVPLLHPHANVSKVMITLQMNCRTVITWRNTDFILAVLWYQTIAGHIEMFRTQNEKLSRAAFCS